MSELVGASGLMPSFRRVKDAKLQLVIESEYTKNKTDMQMRPDACGFSGKQAGCKCREKEDVENFLIYKRLIIQGKDPNR